MDDQHRYSITAWLDGDPTEDEPEPPPLGIIGAAVILVCIAAGLFGAVALVFAAVHILTA